MTPKLKWIILGCSGVVILIIKKYMGGAVCRSKVLLHGKTVIITGANSGIGKATALELAKRNARVILACRQIKNAEETAAFIRRSVKDAQLVPMQLDLASLSSVTHFAKQISSDEQTIDVLINNAGVFQCPYGRTGDGFEMQMGTNHFGHFYLTNLLLDKLRSSVPSRIIVVTSVLSKYGSIDIDNINYTDDGSVYDPARAYSNSKLANNMFARELAVRVRGDGIGVFCVSPGIVLTNLGRHVHYPAWMKVLGYPLAWFFMKTPWEGCQTTVYCAVSDELSDMECSGKFYRNCKVAPWNAESLDDQKCQRLWEISTKLTGLNSA